MKEEQDLIPYIDDNDKMGFKNRNGQIIIPAQWNMVYDFHEGLAKVQNWKYGFINIKGIKFACIKLLYYLCKSKFNNINEHSYL